MGKTLEECYELLGLDYGAAEDEIKSAYRKKALQCHPDKNPDDPLSTQKFQELGHAYRRLTGEEDSDSDDEYDDDDMDLWRKFFFFLFRDEILQRVRCKCDRCGRAAKGHDDDDFLAFLAKEQEEQFTKEEMAQFTSFSNLKEQREANKRKFCDRNLPNSKPEQKANKGNKTKLKSNKQLKAEQWKREKEISEVAAQINQANQTLQGNKAFSKDAKTTALHQHKRSDHPGVVGQGKSVKEHTDGACNKRNTRKKKNRNKSRPQNDNVTGSNHNNHMKTTFTEQKFASSFVVPDAVRNVTIKPETTRRQDDLSGRLPHYTSYTSSSDTTHSMNSQRSAPQKQNGRGWYEYPKTEAPARPTCVTNIWQRRQEKQQLLAQLQPCDQNDEELQLQMALELSKKQAEIDAQQREISILEKQMEETLQFEEQLKRQTSEEETVATPATDMGPDSFPPLGDPAEYISSTHVDEEWVLSSDSEDEWQECEQETKDSGELVYNSDDDYVVETSEQLQKSKHHDSNEEHLSERFTGSGEASRGDNMTVHKSDVQLPQHYRRQDSQESDSCPYGKNCCLGKRCTYSHPLSIDNRKNQKSVENNSVSQDQCDLKCNDKFHPCSPTEKQISSIASCEEFPEVSKPSYGVNSIGHSDNVFNVPIGSQSLRSLQSEAPMIHVPESDSPYGKQEFNCTGESDTLNGVSSEDSNQRVLNKGKLENVGQSSKIDIPIRKSRTLLKDGFSSDEEATENNSTSDLPSPSNGRHTVIGNPVEAVKDSSTVLCENSAPEAPSIISSGVTAPTVYVIADSQFPFGFPVGSGLKQSASVLPPTTSLSAGAKLQNSPQVPHQSYIGQISAAMSANVVPQASAAIPQCSGPGISMPQTVSGSPEISSGPLSGSTLQTPAAIQQPNTVGPSTSLQTETANSFPVVPGFPFLPFANVYPFINPANVAASASMMAASPGGTPFPITPGASNSAQSQQGGAFAMNQAMLQAYLKAGLGNGISPLGQFLPTQAQLNGLPVMTMEGGSVPMPHPGQPSQAGITSDPQSATPNLPQPFSVPFPFINPQTFVNINTGMPLGIPYSGLQNGCQTSSPSGLAPPSHVHVKNKTTEQFRGVQKGAGVTTHTVVKRDSGEEKGGASVGFGGKTQLLRRPVTIPMVIQQQVSKER